MNFLAHCALADDASNSWPTGEDMRQGLLAGAILADFGKGPVPKSMPNALQTGIRLHRRIDAFSNQQATIREVCATFGRVDEPAQLEWVPVEFAWHGMFRH